MRLMQFLIVLAGVLAVLSLSGVGGAVAAEAMPCHEASDHHAPAPDHQDPAGMKTMACCAACVTTPTPAAPETTRLRRVPVSRGSVSASPLPGRAPDLEPRPPKSPA